MSVRIACGRLADERKAWRKNHRHTDWEGGHYPLTMHFSEDYPSKPRSASFHKVSFIRMCILQELYVWLSSMRTVGGGQPLQLSKFGGNPRFARPAKSR